MMNDDMTLIREFVASRSESAFATLVERHIGLVYSVALRQTGDTALAEEIAQSVFLLLARKASSLGAKTILSSWLYRATRYTAADALKAQRRRQAREQEACLQSTLNQPDDYWLQLAPLLDDAMDELGETDRAALVLRFFERKTAREIAGALRMEEAAAQKRVMRALEKLRTIFVKQGVTLSATAIAGGLASNAVQAAPVGLAGTISAIAGKGVVSAAGIGIFSKCLSLLGKSVVDASIPALFAVIASLPGLVFNSFIKRLTLENYRDPVGFRPRLIQWTSRYLIWRFFGTMAVLGMACYLTVTSVGIFWWLRCIGLLSILITLLVARSLTVCRNRFQIAVFLSSSIISVSYCALALGWIPLNLFHFPIIFSQVLLMFEIAKRPARMDYSLFLRAERGMLETQIAQGDSPVTNRFDRQELLSFARFLGAHYLLVDFRWEPTELTLRLAPVGRKYLSGMADILLPAMFHRGSFIVLGWDGTVRSRCGDSDLVVLAALNPVATIDRQKLEASVAEAVVLAWKEFRNGNLDLAARALGESPESDIFIVPSHRTKAARWMRRFAWSWAIVATALLMVMLIVILKPEWLSGLKPVAVTEAEVREFLNDTRPNQEPGKMRHNSPEAAIFFCLALPSANLFSREGLDALRNEIPRAEGLNEWKHSNRQADIIYDSAGLQRAIADGWIGWNDMNIRTQDMAAYIRTNASRLNSPERRDRGFAPSLSRPNGSGKSYIVTRLRLDSVAWFRFLHDMDCLDLIDRNRLIRKIADVQVLSAKPARGEIPIRNWKGVRGLFLTPNWPVLVETYCSIAALELLGGLDKIDREACIQGILRRHYGKGYFAAPLAEDGNEYHIDGGAHDTIAAYESLRILGALDRVKDLDQWQFRVHGGRISNIRLTWTDVEAWICSERFKKIMEERKRNPQKPFGSLLEPNGI